MAFSTYTKSGTKAATAAKLEKGVFELTVENHDLLKQAYLTYLANGRENLATTKTRGKVSGGGRKPWKQKGTGRARFGSSRNPIWRGGGVVFGPDGTENYSKSINLKAKRLALRQALSLANESGKLSVIESIDFKDGKVTEAIKFFDKIGVSRNILLVVESKTDTIDRATRNLQNVKLVSANYVNVFDLLNADSIVVSQKGLDVIHEWLGGDK